MAKTKISEFDSTPANNTDIDSINIAEGCAPSGINNAIRELMSQLKDQQTGASGDNFTVGGNLVVTGTSVHTGATTFTGAVVMSTALPVSSGGTGATTAGNARTNLSAAGSGANSDITSITGLTTALSVPQGGTGAVTHTSKGVLIGNGTSAITTISPGTIGNVLISDGTSWTSAGSGGAFGQAFTSSGTFTIPSGVTRLKITVVGGGANGGAGQYQNNCTPYAGGDGGNGSGTAVLFGTNFTPGNTLVVTVGASNGGTSTVASGTQTITTISANTTAVSGGTVNTLGGAGSVAIFAAVPYYSGGAGSGGAGWGGFGGGGGSGVSTNEGGAGGVGGAGYGGGGGGGGAAYPPNNGAGGAGKQGIVVFEW